MGSSTRRERQRAREKTVRRSLRLADRESRRRRRNALVAGGTAATVLLGVVGFAVLGLLPDDPDVAASDFPESATPSASASALPPVPDELRQVACGAVAPEPPQPQSYDAEPPLDLVEGADYVMTLVTSCGTIVVDLWEDEAPRTVNSYSFLAGNDFFDGAPFSRLTTVADDRFAVLQGGDQEGTGTGGPGYTLPDENLEGATYPRGTIAMANGGPGTGGSQFFLVAEDAPLGPSYTPFGRVESGLDVLDRILALGHDRTNPAGGGRPNERVFLEDLTVAVR